RSMKTTSSGMQYVQRRLQRSVTLTRRLLCTRPKVSINFRLQISDCRLSDLVAMSISSFGSSICNLKSRVDPLGAAVVPVFLLPDGHQFLEPVDGVTTRLERLAAVRAADGDGDAHLADFQMPEPVDHDHLADGPALACLPLDLGHFFLGHAGIR